MRRYIITIAFILGLLPFSTALFAAGSVNADYEDGPEKMIRIFLNSGEIMDFDVAEIDSITSNSMEQMIWSFGECTSIAVEAIDSVCYISPILRLSTGSLDFGKVAVGNSKTINITMTNTGKYQETYFVMVEGVFSVEGSGQDIKILPGEAKDVVLTFQPTEADYYFSEMRVSSFSVENGLLSLPLTGKGVENDRDEASVYLPPSEVEFEVVLPDNVPEEELGGFKIVNCNGEFPIDASQSPSRIRKVKKANGDVVPDNIFLARGLASNNGMQLNFLVNRQDVPLAFFWSLPGENLMDMSPEQTAISLLMTEPLLITSNQTEYNNTVATIKDLHPQWDNFLKDVTHLYMQGVMNGYCPDYSSIESAKPVLFQLMRKVYDNHELTLSGLSLDDFTRTGEAAMYRIHNNYKRVVHAYPSRVKMNEANGNVEAREGASYTFTELCDWMLNSADLVGNELDEEDRGFINDLKEWIGDVEQMIVGLGFGDADSHIQLPIILESGHANYWKIVKGSLQGDESSIFEVVSDPITTEFKDFDKIFIDIYGMGKDMDNNEFWNKFSGMEKFKVAFMLMHSVYKDYIKPIMQLGSGIIDAVNATGYDNYNYDLRYGARKAPERALFMKLVQDFYSDPNNESELKKNLLKGDFWGVAKQLTTFACDRILSSPEDDPNDDKRTYANLIYNIYKKWTGNAATSKEFKKNFKKVANNLTHLKKANFASKIINLSEVVLDIAGTIDAYYRSTVKNTFVIDKSDHPYITVIEPETYQKTMGGNIHFKWEVYKAKNFGQFKYDIELYIETPNKKIIVTPISNFVEKECDINLSSLLSSNNASDAVMVKYKIIAHHPDNPSTIYANTEFETLATTIPVKKPLFVNLGLPSGTWWANCNYDADTNFDFGNYYAWGETTGYENGKTNFSWSTYKYCQGTSTSLTKYCPKDIYGANGFTDNLTKLQGSDDPVTRLYGYDFRIPTKEQWEELMTWCDWTKMGNGVKVTARYGPAKGNYIYLPAAGYRQGMNLYDAGTEGYYWSSTLDENSPDDAWFLYFGNGKPKSYDYYRSCGRTIRPVMKISSGQQAPRMQAPSDQPETPKEMHCNGIVVKTMSRSAVTIQENNQ